MKPVLLCLLLATVLPNYAEECFPKPGWTDKPNPLASPDAVPGGELSTFGFQFPKSFNPYLDNNSFSADLFSMLYESLLSLNPLSPDYEPGLAEKWSISDDKRTFTFWLNPKATWSDGRPVTAADVKWTFDAIMNPANLTGPHKVALEKFSSPVVVDDRCIRFTTTEVHWRNLGAVGSLQILPRHAFEKLDFNKINFEFPVVSGPYRMGTVREGLSVTLERRADWWNRNSASSRGIANFQTLKYKFYDSQETAFEAFRKGEFDLFPIYMARLWMNETSGEKFSNNWIIRQKISNYDPIGFQGFAMNMRRPPFDDVRVRKALCHLVNRERMNATLMYNQYFLHRSYVEDLYDAGHPCPNPLTAFDKDQARKLLAEAGWKANPATGLLEKDGHPFRFRFLEREASSGKFLSIVAEDLRDAGIDMQIDSKDQAAWTRDMDEFNFDMTWAAFGSSLFKDPEGPWSSREADRKMSSNISGFKDSTVDALIEKQKPMFDVAARHALCRDIDRIVFAQYPYALLWNINYKRLVYWNKFGTPPTVLGKYNNESGAPWYWWYDEDAAADLKDAMKQNRPLLKRSAEVTFDTAFTAPLK
ncbi:MAG: extracellular solute-binding protein [bacterium]